MAICPSKSLGKTFPWPFPGFHYLLAVLGVLSLAWSCIPSLSPHPHEGSLCLCLHILLSFPCICTDFLFIYDISHWIRAHSIPGRPHLNLMTATKTLFARKIIPETQGGHELWGDISNPAQPSSPSSLSSLYTMQYKVPDEC